MEELVATVGKVIRDVKIVMERNGKQGSIRFLDGGVPAGLGPTIRYTNGRCTCGDHVVELDLAEGTLTVGRELPSARLSRPLPERLMWRRAA